MLASGKAGKGRAVSHVQIHVAIAVVIEKGGPAHHPLDYVALVGPRDIGLRQAGGRCLIDELRGERLAPPANGPHETQQQRPHYSCSTTNTLSTNVRCRSCTLPSGHVISIRSTSAQSPKPKCNRPSLADR